MRRWRGKSSSDLRHLPVMADKVVQLVGECPDGIFVDATVGSGGHLEAVYRAHGSRFQYFGFDIDSEILEQTRGRFSQRNIAAALINSNFSEIAGYLQRRGVSQISAVLFDLGIGSFQIDDPSRGFSYLEDGPLSMSFESRKARAADVIKNLSEGELTKLLREYGQEPKAKALARAIKGYPGDLTTAGQLSEIIRSVAGGKRFIKTAARVFQALRIEVNREFINITMGLERILPLIIPGGRALAITYHSLEDHLVKRIFRKYSGHCICPPRTPECRCGKIKLFSSEKAKPLVPSQQEVEVNTRARSAKLRVVKRIAVTP
jgi:16S rRNA (cytosine1402-N4)-methyltransferase